ncbi:hypothetical protein QQX98_010311 [Neonectria punicea]|uniref:Peptidase S8/S53 domain-containing protein n=1 Tax=Neonectria punicea TaxID=979145 RepID=A0ABR1GPX2_9HYPO
MEGEKVRRPAKNKKTGAKSSKSKKAENARQQPQLTKRENIRKKQSLPELLLEVLKNFPECYGECATPREAVEGDKQDRSLQDSEHDRALADFETLFKSKLKDATSRARDGSENLFHFLVMKRWWETSKAKLFFNWMLLQHEHHVLLGLEDHRGFTPMHNALFDKVDDFIDVVLEVHGLNVTGILEKKCSAGNCLHLATKHSFPNLVDMISKCTGNMDIFMGEERSPEDTPLHIAVQNVQALVSYDEAHSEMGDESERAEDDDDQHHQPIYDDDRELEDDDDDDDSDFQDTSEDDRSLESEGYLMNEEGLELDEEVEDLERESFRLESEEEREKRLTRVINNLDKDMARPRPVPSEEEDTFRSSQDTLFQHSMELPPQHSVRLLVEACPEALTIKNKADRTPYQEREYVLLNDPLVQKLVKAYAEKKPRPRGETEEIRESRARRIIVVEDPVAHYIRSFCMRKSRSREETMKRLYKPGHECHIEFDLEGMPTPVMKHEYLDQLEKHLKFESILKYVALPVLSVEPRSSRNPRSLQASPKDAQSELHRTGRSDLVAVFDWLWRRGVREIIKVMVVDDGDHPHADAAIVDALYGFKVEEWDWKRVDLCSDVIYESSPAVREVSLYSSGNNAVLMGWASAEGLGNRDKFPHLKKINLFVQDGLDDNERWKRNNRRFQERIFKQVQKGQKGLNGGKIDVKIIADNHAVKFSSGLSTTESIEEAPPWIRSIREYSTFLMNASMSLGKGKQVSSVKIAIIDDGIDATLHDLQSKIAGGATFCPYPHSSVLVNSYFVPRGKHGTLMAQLICDICPATQLYIARLEELPALTGSGRRVTARSAAKAVDWAVSCGVDIISMSWTIQATGQENEDIDKLKAAINKANSKNILMFCSASDQGANNKDECFPGGWNQCIRIGGATFTGEKLTWVDDRVDFWFPGRNVPFPSKDHKSITYESGSSVATAAASGLAGVLILSARLLHGDEYGKDKRNPFQDRTAMVNAFTMMARGSDGKFPRTDDIFNKLFKKKISQAALKPSRSVEINTLDWNDASKNALGALLMHIQGS